MTFESDLSRVVQSLAANDTRHSRYLASQLTPANCVSKDLLNHCVGIAVKLELPDLALNALSRLLVLDPENKQAINNIGVIHESTGDLVTAIAHYRSAVSKDGNYIDALFNLANGLQRILENTEAVALYHRILAINPKHDGAHLNLGILALQADDIDGAIREFNSAISANPGLFEAFLNLGYAYYRAKRYQEAEATYGQAANLSEKNPHLLNNQGLLAQALGDFSTAERLIKEAIGSTRRFDEAEHSLGLLYLSEFRFEKGWKLYQKRPSRRASNTPAPAIIPLVPGNSLYVQSEQGIGDELFFLRFLPLLSEQGINVRYVASERIGSLLKTCTNIPLASVPPDVHTNQRIWVGDLPEILGHKDTQHCPAPLSLRVDRNQQARYNELLRNFPRPWIGVSWKAGVTGINTLDKRVPLDTLWPILQDKPGTIVLLQRNPGANEIDQIARNSRSPICDATAANADLVAMTAILSLMDDYIAVSNTNAHIRAGLGLSMRILVPHPPDWRWGNNLAASPWFPKATIYRQSTNRDWQTALAALNSDMAYSVQN